MLIGPQNQAAIDLLLSRGDNLFRSQAQSYRFTGDPDIDSRLNDLERLPHLFVLACVMDRQIKTGRIWTIPYQVALAIGGFEFSYFISQTREEFERIFLEKNLHSFSKTMAGYFYKAVQKIANEYGGDAARLWKEGSTCDDVMNRFLEFEGICTPTVSMALKLLVSEFGFPLEDSSCLDMTPDAPIKRVLTRLGLIETKTSKNDIVVLARELNPGYPGIFEKPLREVEANWCRPKDPSCSACYLNEYCPKRNVSLHAAVENETPQGIE